MHFSEQNLLTKWLSADPNASDQFLQCYFFLVTFLWFKSVLSLASYRR